MTTGASSAASFTCCNRSHDGAIVRVNTASSTNGGTRRRRSGVDAQPASVARGIRGLRGRQYLFQRDSRGRGEGAREPQVCGEGQSVRQGSGNRFQKHRRCPYTTIYNRFNRWSKQGLWFEIFRALTGSSGVIGTACIDSTHIKAHRSAGGGKGGLTPRRSDARAAAGRRSCMP